jgi:hypothetical protein
MILSIFLVLFEILIGYYWLTYQHIFYLNAIFVVCYFLINPVIYIIIAKFFKKKYLNYFSFISILILLIVAFFRDGKTLFKDNPDSSVFGWFIAFSLYRVIIIIISIILLNLIIYLLNKLKKKNPKPPHNSQ